MQVNGIWLPCPAQLDVNTEDLDIDSFRTTDGLMHRQRISKKIKLSVSWNVIPQSNEFYSLYQVLDNLPEFFTVTFPHPNGNNFYSITAYRGNPLSVSMRSFYNTENGNISKWQNLKVNFIER